MILPHPIVVLRHPKERRAKCTMQPLWGRPGLSFFNARPGFQYDASGHLVLSMNAPLLTKADGNWMAAERNALDEQWASGGIPPQSELFPPRCLRPILMLDATWRRLPQVEGCVSGDPLYRGLGSGWKTAYPRINADGKDPDAGLATIEALYVALRLLGVEAETVFSEYRWKNDFLELNRERLEII